MNIKDIFDIITGSYHSDDIYEFPDWPDEILNWDHENESLEEFLCRRIEAGYGSGYLPPKNAERKWRRFCKNIGI